MINILPKTQCIKNMHSSESHFLQNSCCLNKKGKSRPSLFTGLDQRHCHLQGKVHGEESGDTKKAKKVFKIYVFQRPLTCSCWSYQGHNWRRTRSILDIPLLLLRFWAQRSSTMPKNYISKTCQYVFYCKKGRFLDNLPSTLH